ncbi:hypothetical protein [Botrytis cinerea mycovirus 3]|nr:hypothetical protein [Botrytis cinerea mycovirus 3]
MTTAAPDFATLFGGAQAPVNYNEAPQREADYLPVPDPTDDLQTIAKKITALSRVVERGASVAVHTGFRKAAHDTLDAEETAKLAMTPPELMQYEAWKKGAVMPSIDWTTHQADVPAGAGSEVRFARRAEAMNTIWKTELAGPRNAAWLTKSATYMLPVIIAVCKVEGARRDLTGGNKNMSEMDMAEVQTIHKVCAVAMDRMNVTFAALRKLSAEINAAKDILQAREHALKTGIEGYKPKKDPANDVRAAVGIPKIGRSVDYTAKTGGKRDARTDLLGGTGLTRAGAQKKRRTETGAADVTMAENMDY